MANQSRSVLLVGVVLVTPVLVIALSFFLRRRLTLRVRRCRRRFGGRWRRGRGRRALRRTAAMFAASFALIAIALRSNSTARVGRRNRRCVHFGLHRRLAGTAIAIGAAFVRLRRRGLQLGRLRLDLSLR